MSYAVSIPCSAMSANVTSPLSSQSLQAHLGWAVAPLSFSTSSKFSKGGSVRHAGFIKRIVATVFILFTEMIIWFCAMFRKYTLVLLNFTQSFVSVLRCVTCCLTPSCNQGFCRHLFTLTHSTVESFKACSPLPIVQLSQLRQFIQSYQLCSSRLAGL